LNEEGVCVRKYEAVKQVKIRKVNNGSAWCLDCICPKEPPPPA
jgi:hypothetical protein